VGKGTGPPPLDFRTWTRLRPAHVNQDADSDGENADDDRPCLEQLGGRRAVAEVSVTEAVERGEVVNVAPTSTSDRRVETTKQS